MAASVNGIFRKDLQDAIIQSKVLVIGAGGIGCEILKNLVMTGFKDIEILDLDTIDVSNLNRQFLFQKQHVGKSKSAVARETALTFNPDVKIVSYHDNITSSDYGLSFFKRFSLVMNALDNRAARNHVNRMCLAADIPLIESGTAGYDGQVELIKKGLSVCYECLPKPTQKTFPGCTIRNTPSEPIHCIVWSKHLFNQLFGEEDPDQDVSPDTADPEAAGDKAGEGALNSDSNEKGNIERVSTRLWAQSSDYDPEKLFNKLFHDDIKYLLSMDNLWKKRRPPTPLDWKNLPDVVAGCSKENNDDTCLKEQQKWSIAKCADVFSNAVHNLKTNLSKLREKSPNDHLVWDKDDQDAMDFVAACANIRAHIFGISQKSRFDVKSMAGNIIPAIATTNAIVAGIVILHAFRILRGLFEECKSVYLRPRPNHRGQLLVPEKCLNPPNPKCYVCAPTPSAALAVDTTKMTIAELDEIVLKGRLNMIQPDVMIDGKGVVLISSEEGETEENNGKILEELGVRDGTILKVDDFQQNYSLTVTVVHREKPTGRAEGDDFLIVADEMDLKPKEEVKREAAPSTSNGQVDESDEEDCVEVEVEVETPGEVVAKKRKTGSIEKEVPSPKKRRTDSQGDDDCCIVAEGEKSSGKKAHKRAIANDDECLIVFDEGKDISVSPKKKINPAN
ncbi:SUMO-activating enzyme subunit 2 [Fopius arisanus]|uniref:SUMO-activating enzyme subunit n=1 Tax=Fopius arisanus TaxID=64838 RepID=A0A0C9QK38_9HYME|nr:PREDICTED: SUMO-activating enzyme subunit 2 [Fopius arisanus]XP_011310204.1 PREDICTED: SUMO-activating enzyme subunit 2 [Fopius arisanus]